MRLPNETPIAGHGPIFVTGACGFVGANICRYFSERGQSVVGIEGPNGRSWRLPDLPNVVTHQVDLLDRVRLAALVDEVQPQVVVNCAAYGAYSNQTDVERIYAVNVVGLRHVLEAARLSTRLRAFVQLGSSSEYGMNCEGPSEASECWPDSDYAVSKVAGTAMVRFFATKHGLPAFSFRLYSVYGPLEDMSRLIPQLLLKAQNGDLPPLVNPDISRDFVYVDDVCDAIVELSNRVEGLRPGDTFNIGTGVCSTLGKLVDTARAVFQIEAQPRWGTMADRHWDHTRWFGNPAHAKDALSWHSQTDLSQGLSRTMAWMQDNPTLVNQALQATVIGAL